MAFQTINNLLIIAAPSVGDFVTPITANAAGESCGVVGRVVIEGNAASKTISAAGGGSIIWNPSSVTMADVATTVRVGIQDVSAVTGIEDGTFDTYLEYTGGGTIPTAGAINKSVMGSGTKTIGNGDLIAIVVEMVTRGGTDSIAITRVQGAIASQMTAIGLPYGTADTGSPTKSSAAMMWGVIVFDDGTVGWIEGMGGIPFGLTPQAVGSGSTPDEYIGTFTPTVPLQICGFGASLSGIATTETFEAILYSDPYGTPSSVVTLTPDPIQLSNATSESVHLFKCAVTDLSAGTTYGVAIRPTTAATLNWEYIDLGSGNDPLKKTLPLWDLKMAARTDQTGAFVETQAYHVPMIIIDVCGLSDGSGGGGGASAYAFA